MYRWVVSKHLCLYKNLLWWMSSIAFHVSNTMFIFQSYIIWRICYKWSLSCFCNILLTSGLPLFSPHKNWSIIETHKVLLASDIQHQFDNFCTLLKVHQVSVVTICHHKTLIQYYWLYGLCCAFHLYYFIPESSYPLIPLSISSISLLTSIWQPPVLCI